MGDEGVLEELGALVAGLPGPVLAQGLRAALERVAAARGAFERVATDDPGAVLAALGALPPATAAEVGAVLLEVGASLASDEEDDDDDGPGPAPRVPAPGPAVTRPAAPPVASAPTFEEELTTLVRGLPEQVLGLALQATLGRSSAAARDALSSFASGALDPEALLKAILALPLELGDEIGGILLDTAAEVASGDDEDEAPPPPPRPRRRRGPLEIPPGTTFALAAQGKRPARTVTVDRKLAEGGGGLVWLGRDEQRAPIIVKTGKVAGQPPLSLRVEAAVLEPLEFHPNLVRLLGSHTTAQGDLHLFLELLAPNPVLHLNEPRIRERVAQRAQAPGARYLPPPPSTALDLVHDLLSGLAALHGIGLVHNDVKLANFMLALDRRDAELDDAAYFLALEKGEYHGVLIDAGGIRSVEALAELNRGEGDPDLPVELTPIYAPPEALIGRLGDPDERPFYSPAIDVYAAALVAYTTITGYAPYSHLRAQPKDLPATLEIKRAERRGAVSPISREALREARFFDARFAEGSAESCRQRFEEALAAFLLRRVDPDPARRGTIAEMRRDFAQLGQVRARTRAEFLAAKKIGERGPRLYDQNLFVAAGTDPTGRLAQAAGRAVDRRASGRLERFASGRHERPPADPGSEEPAAGRHERFSTGRHERPTARHEQVEPPAPPDRAPTRRHVRPDASGRHPPPGP